MRHNSPDPLSRVSCGPSFLSCMDNDKQRIKRKKKKTRTREPIPPPPFPIDTARTLEYLRLADVAGLMRKSIGSIKKRLDGRPDDSKDEIGEALRAMVCYPFGRDRYIRAKAFCEWYDSRQRTA